MAVGRKYEVPKSVDLAEVADLTPETKEGTELKPTTLVVCLNRGPKTIRDQFNAVLYVVAPYQQFRCEYQVAAHLQRRNIVAGTRNPDPMDSTAPQFVPWIAILGLDPEDQCHPFTPEQLEAFGEKAEGLDRSGMSGVNRNIEIVDTNTVRRTLPGHGNASSAAIAREIGARGRQSVEGDPDAVADALAPVEGSDAVSEQLEAAAAGHQMPSEEQLSVRSAPPPSDPARARKRR